MALTKQDLHARLNRIFHERDPFEQFSPDEFEALVAYLLEMRGYEAHRSRPQSDGGVDIQLTAIDPLGSEQRIVVQCKHFRSGTPVGEDVIRQMHSYVDTRRGAASALVVTSSTFTPRARAFARDFPSVRLVDRSELLLWMAEARRTDETTTGALAYQLDRLPIGKRFGKIDLPLAGLALPSSEVIVPQLHLPSPYAERLLTVEQVPIELVRRLATDPRTMHDLTPRQFEEFIAELVDGLGFQNVILTPRSGDGGRDVIASLRAHGIPMTFYFECKKYAEDNVVQLDTLRALLGVVAHNGTDANIGVLVTTSHFTKGCRELIASECRLDGKDYGGIVDWLGEYKKTYPRL